MYYKVVYNHVEGYYESACRVENVVPTDRRVRYEVGAWAEPVVEDTALFLTPNAYLIRTYW